jgi:hypothetical protein
MAFHEKVQ